MAPLISPISDPPLGGAQTMVADLATGLGARGHEVQVYAASGSRVRGAEVVDTGVDAAALEATRFHSGSAPPSAAAAEAFRHVYAMVRGGGHGLVHNHAFDPAAVLSATVIDSPVIHTLHLPADVAMAAALARVRRSQRPPLVAAVSQAQGDAWRRVAHLDTVIPNGVPTRLIPWSGRPGQGALFAGRLSPEKGCREAIQIALAAGSEIDVYGDPYDVGYASLMVEPLGGRAGVRLHAPLRRAELWRRMAGVRAVLCPAMWDEPFGLIAAEAQATGTPVVGFRRGGLPEVVRDGVTGHLVDAGDVEAAAVALCGSAELDRRSCRRHAESALDLEPVLDAHERLYRQALTGARALA